MPVRLGIGIIRECVQDFSLEVRDRAPLICDGVPKAHDMVLPFLARCALASPFRM